MTSARARLGLTSGVIVIASSNTRQVTYCSSLIPPFFFINDFVTHRFGVHDKCTRSLLTNARQPQVCRPQIQTHHSTRRTPGLYRSVRLQRSSEMHRRRHLCGLTPSVPPSCRAKQALVPTELRRRAWIRLIRNGRRQESLITMPSTSVLVSIFCSCAGRQVTSLVVFFGGLRSEVSSSRSSPCTHIPKTRSFHMSVCGTD